MRIALLALFTLGCTSVGGIQPQDTAVYDADTDTDTDAYTDTDTHTHPDGDTDAYTDADTDADVDLSPEGIYEGEVYVLADNDWWPMECWGSFELTIDEDDNAEGYAICDLDYFTLEGVVGGEVREDEFLGWWTLYESSHSGEEYDVELEGTVGGGEIYLDLYQDMDYFVATGTFEGTRIE